MNEYLELVPTMNCYWLLSECAEVLLVECCVNVTRDNVGSFLGTTSPRINLFFWSTNEKITYLM